MLANTSTNLPPTRANMCKNYLPSEEIRGNTTCHASKLYHLLPNAVAACRCTFWWYLVVFGRNMTRAGTTLDNLTYDR